MDLKTEPSSPEDNIRTGKTNLSPALLEYCRAHEHCERLYGSRTLLMMQIGSFLEMYELRLEGGEHVGNASAMASSLNQMKETVLPQTGPDVKWYNGIRVDRIIRYGFTLLEESKKTYIGIATRNGYTVPVYYQVGKDPSRGIENRKCLEVWSPMVRPADGERSSRWFVAVLLSSWESSDAELGFMNPVTRTYISRKVMRDGAVSTDSHDMFSIRPPSEIVVWVRETAGAGSVSGSEDSLRRVWGIPRDCPMRVIRIRGRTLDVGGMTRNVLMRYVGDRTVATGDGSISDSVARALDYMRNVVPMAVEGVRFIQDTSDDTQLVLENQPLRQLNMIPGSHDVTHIGKHMSCVMNLLDKTMTHMGRRLHTRRISSPTAQEGVVHKRQALGKWCTDDSDRVRRLGDIFKDMPDLGSLFSARVYGGMSYVLLWRCAMAIKSFVSGAMEMDIPIKFSRDDCIRFYEMIERVIVSPTDTPSGGQAVGGIPTHTYTNIGTIKPDVPFRDPYPTTVIHENHRKLLGNIRILEHFVSAINGGGSSSKNGALPKNAVLRLAVLNGTYYIVGAKASGSRIVSSRRYGEVSWKNAKIEKLEGIAGRGTSYILSGNTSFTLAQDCEYTMLSNILRETTRLRTLVDDEVASAWIDWTSGVQKKYEGLIREISETVATVDVARSSAIVVRSMGYVWPGVSSSESSWVECVGLRHPLIESIRQDVPYVPHTISVGDKENTPIGRLVFGVNSSGKSSLMKSLGIAVILAQVGLPVPAKSMRISMFTSLFTRILGNDDLFRGLSTFRVEADEIVRILRKSDHRSLVLGDELCSGTEQIGAESLVTASILTLLRRRCAFLFATHLHRVRDIPDLIHHPRLAWNHLRIDVDKDGVMHMDRRLQDGAGPRGYAIDYVERMGGDTATMYEARRIRDMITSEEFSLLSSRAWTKSNQRGYADADETHTSWNSRAGIQTVCQICKQKPAEETDHIIPREYADKMGGVGGVGSVHSGGNLVGLCSACHERKTRGEIVIHGYEETLVDGKIVRNLRWEESADTVPNSSEDYVHTLIIRMNGFGKTPRQIQGFLRRNGHRVRLSEISSILGSH